MKKIAISCKLLLLTLIIGYITSCSNRKDLQYIAETTRALNEQQLVNRFLQVPADANEDVKKIIANIAKTEKATPFLANYAAKFGVPEWKYMFGDKNKLATPSQSNSSNYAELGSGNNSTTNSNRGFYFIPLTDSVTKRTKAYIYCQQYNDSLYTYRTYDVDAILAANPTNDTAKQNKEVALGFAAYFERKINGSVQTEAFKNNKFSNAEIKDTDSNTTNNTGTLGTRTLDDSKPCEGHIKYLVVFIDGNGEVEDVWQIRVTVPCPTSGGGATVVPYPWPNLGNGGTINPPPPPPSNIPPAINNPPSTTSPPSVSNPPNYGSYPGYTPPSGGGGFYNGPDPGSSNPGYGHGPYLPPYYWDVWNPYDPNLYPWGNIYPQQPIIYNPQLQSLINTLGLTQTQIDWLDQHPLYADELYDLTTAEDVVVDEVKAAARLALSTVINNDFVDADIINEVGNIQGQTINDPILGANIVNYFIFKFATLKGENNQLPPSQQKSDIKLLYLTFSDAMHTGFDLLGLIPVGGEVFDVINGFTYYLEGDRTNAYISYASAIPIAGYAATTVKAIKAGSVIIAVVGKTGKLVAKRVSQKAFSKACGAIGSKVGHHIITFH